MQAAAPPPGAPPQPVGAPSDERALKHHYFFQKLYTPSAIDGDDDICFGTGYRAPKVPIVLQSIPEGKGASRRPSLHTGMRLRAIIYYARLLPLRSAPDASQMHTRTLIRTALKSRAMRCALFLTKP